MNPAEKVKALLDHQLLLSPDAASEADLAQLPLHAAKVLVLTKDVLHLQKDIDFLEFEKARFLLEKRNEGKLYAKFLSLLSIAPEGAAEEPQAAVEVVFSYQEKPRKRVVQDFVSFYNVRFKNLERMLRQRQELQSAISISRLLAKKEKETSAIIGIIYEKSLSKNGNLILTLEDSTGMVKVMVSKTRTELFSLAKDLCLDEVVGIIGSYDNKMLFASNLYLPDIPLDKELKKGPEEIYAVFAGDLHVGSKLFLEKEFNRFILWLQGKLGTERQREIARKTKYLILTGDLVEGVGVYPGQEKDLSITDIYAQYQVFTEILKQVPKNISIIACPGNHDAGRLSEPQPPLFSEFAAAMKQLPNLYLVSNPAYLRIGRTAAFPGFDILLYHGGSLIYYAEHVESIRAAGGQKKADAIMKYLLQQRHLAPSHAATLFVPDPDRDPLVIDQVPDFFVTGHIHRMMATTYRNITLMNCSCWVSISENQEKRGLEPQPAKIAIVNLQTRETKIMNFASKEE